MNSTFLGVFEEAERLSFDEKRGLKDLLKTYLKEEDKRRDVVEYKLTTSRLLRATCKKFYFTVTLAVFEAAEAPLLLTART